jgi:IS5 family transposase
MTRPRCKSPARTEDKGEHPFRVINRQCGFQKTRLRGMLKNRCQLNVLAALANLCAWPATCCEARRD